MDGSEMYPEGFHPIRQHLDPSAKIEVVPMTRTMAKPKYYIIDFDGAVSFPADMPARFRTSTGKHGADDEVPEMSQNGPYDPFKVDIFQFGNVLKREFLEVCLPSLHLLRFGADRLAQKYVGLEFLESMVRDMTHPNPPDRPSVGSIIARFTRLRSNLRPNQLKRALSPKASSDPLRDHLRSLGISRDPLEPDPGLDEVEEEDSDDPTLGLRTTSSGETHDSAGSAAAEDYWDSEATRRSVSTAATSLATSPTTTSPPPIPGIGSVFSQWLPGRPKSPVALKKGPPPPIVVPQNPISPTSPQGDFLGGRRGPLPFFARSLSPDSVSPSPSSPTSPISIHPHHRKGSGGASGTLARLTTGKFPWTVSESPSSRASTPDIEKFKHESDFIAYVAGNGGPGNNSASPTSPSNSWSKAMNGLHGFMGGKKKGRERSNSKLSISSETGPWGSASAAASASAVDMANWGSNPEDVVVPPPSNPTPPSGGLAAFWGLGKSSSSPPVKKEKKSKSISTAPAPNAAGWDIPKPEGSSSSASPWPPANDTPAELVKDTRPSSKASTAKPTPASTPPSATPAPVAKLSKKANKKAAQSSAGPGPVPTPITEEDLPPKTTEEEEWTPGPSSVSPPPKGTSAFRGVGKEEKKKKKAEKAEMLAPLPPTSPPSAKQPSLIAAMADAAWNEEPEQHAYDMSQWAGTEHSYGYGPDSPMVAAFNATARGSPFPTPRPDWESPRTAAPPISTSQLQSAGSFSRATPTTSGKSTPAPAMPVGKADKRTPVSNQAPGPGRSLGTEENPDASDWMAFTNRTKTGGLRPSKLSSSVVSAGPDEKLNGPTKAGTSAGWAVKQGGSKQESSAWGAFGASPTDPAFQAKTKARAPEQMRKSAQAGTGAGPPHGGWGSINTPVQPPIDGTWDTWSVRSVPAIEIVSPPAAAASAGPRGEAPPPPPPVASPPNSWKTPGSTAATRISTATMMDGPSATHTARSSWTSLVKEPHGFSAAQWKFNGSGSTLGPVFEGARESGGVNDVWDMDMGANGSASDGGVPWQGEISPELLRSLQGPLEYSSGSDRESRKRKSEIGSGLRRPESGFKSAFANLSDSGEEKGKASLVPNKHPLNNVSDSSSRSSWSAFPKKATSSPSGFGLSKSPPAAPAVIASTAKGKTAASATVRPTTRMPGGFASWDEEDGEPRDVDLDQMLAMVDEPMNSEEPAPRYASRREPAAPPRAPVVSMPAPPTQAAKGKKGKKGKARAYNEEEPEPEVSPMAPVSSAVDDDLLAQLDCSLKPQARPQANPPPSPYKTRTKTVWIEDEVPTRMGSLEASSVPNPLEEKKELEKLEKLEKAKKLEEEEEEKEKDEATTAKAGGGNKKGNNNNNKKGKKRR